MSWICCWNVKLIDGDSSKIWYVGSWSFEPINSINKAGFISVEFLGNEQVISCLEEFSGGWWSIKLTVNGQVWSYAVDFVSVTLFKNDNVAVNSYTVGCCTDVTFSKFFKCCVICKSLAFVSVCFCSCICSITFQTFDWSECLLCQAYN